MATFRKRRSKKYRNKNTRRKSRNARKSNIKRRGKKSLRGGVIFGSLFGSLFGSSKAPDKVSKTGWDDQGSIDGVIIDTPEDSMKTVSEANLEAQRLTAAREAEAQAEENLKRKQEEAEGEIQLIINRQNKTREEATNIYERRVKLLQTNLEADKKEWARNPSKYAWMDERDVGIK